MKIEQTIITSDGKKFKGDDPAQVMNDALAHEDMLQRRALFIAWMDHHGMPNGKGNRRASDMLLLTQWETDRASGLLDKIGATLTAVPETPEAPAETPVPEAPAELREE